MKRFPLLTVVLSSWCLVGLPGCIIIHGGGIANAYPDAVVARVGLTDGRTSTVSLAPGNRFRVAARGVAVRTLAITRADGSRQVFSEAAVAAALQRASDPHDLLVVGPGGLSTRSPADDPR